ncbi:hypothetical protein Cni_G12961 [Canna indica]|uniref:Uncharacterized protein n=1 Tax=Canna indica TaxID=4628 RepID=A0AAQ3K9A7_9LILI|nr:hypothetical protein Cni_G12961 [Canna indica]
MDITNRDSAIPTIISKAIIIRAIITVNSWGGQVGPPSSWDVSDHYRPCPWGPPRLWMHGFGLVTLSSDVFLSVAATGKTCQFLLYKRDGIMLLPLAAGIWEFLSEVVGVFFSLQVLRSAVLDEGLCWSWKMHC